MGRRGIWRWGKREIIHLSLHSHHQNVSCIEMGSNRSHLMFRKLWGTKSQTRQCPQTITFEEKGEPKWILTKVLLLPAYHLTAWPNPLTRMSKWVTSFFIVHFEYLQKWCTFRAVCLLQGWCHMKLLPSRHMFCVHHTTMHQFTMLLHSKPQMQHFSLSPVEMVYCTLSSEKSSEFKPILQSLFVCVNCYQKTFFLF